MLDERSCEEKDQACHRQTGICQPVRICFRRLRAHPLAALPKGGFPFGAACVELALAKALVKLVLDVGPSFRILENIEDDAESLCWRESNMLADKATDLSPFGTRVDSEQLRENVGVALNPGRTRGRKQGKAGVA